MDLIYCENKSLRLLNGDLLADHAGLHVLGNHSVTDGQRRPWPWNGRPLIATGETRGRGESQTRATALRGSTNDGTSCRGDWRVAQG